MLDISDALPLILEGSGRRTELLIPTMLALLFTRRSLWRRRDGYPKRSLANRNGRNHGVGRGVDDRDGVGAKVRHVGSGSTGVMATSAGSIPPGMVAITVLVAVSMTETVLERKFAT